MLFPTTLVGSYPQPEWLIDREKLLKSLPPRVRAQGTVAHPRGVSRRGAGRCHHRSDQGAGGGRPGYPHRRRDPARELLQSLRHRAGRHRPRQPRHRARPLRPPQPGAAHRRSDPAQASGRSRRRQVSAGAHGQTDQDDGAGTLHDEPAGAERLLPRRGGGGNGLRRRGQRGDPRPVLSRRRYRPGRRAVHAGAAREGTPVWPSGAQPRARGNQRTDRSAHLLRLRCDRPPAPFRLLVPARARRLLVPAGLGGDGAIEPRLRRARATCRASRSWSAASTSTT